MILGCDPGLSGALARYDGRELSVIDMPTRIAVVSRKERRVIDEEAVISAVLAYSLMGAEILVIEQVSGMPGQSGPAAFTFGYGVGIVTAAALAAGMKIERVAPSHWKAAMGLKTADKDAARALAVDTFRDQTWKFARKKDDGRAEAALIALWGYQTRGVL